MAAKKKKVTKRRAKSSSSSSVRKFKVQAELRSFVLAKAKSALELKIYSRGEKLGELQIGRGSLYWFGGNRQKAKRINWGDLAKKLDELAYAKKTGRKAT
jgi:hypothetical protein